MVNNRLNEINIELEQLEQRREKLLDERANMDSQLLEAVERANKGQLHKASEDFLKELEQLD